METVSIRCFLPSQRPNGAHTQIDTRILTVISTVEHARSRAMTGEKGNPMMMVKRNSPHMKFSPLAMAKRCTHKSTRILTCSLFLFAPPKISTVEHARSKAMAGEKGNPS
jgi:hypothetical protein